MYLYVCLFICFVLIIFVSPACFGSVFLDQSYWQSSVAAKPKQGVLGFLAGGVVWFAVPFSLGTTMGFAYLAVSARQNHQLLTQAEIDDGECLHDVSTAWEKNMHRGYFSHFASCEIGAVARMHDEQDAATFNGTRLSSHDVSVASLYGMSL